MATLQRIRNEKEWDDYKNHDRLFKEIMDVADNLPDGEVVGAVITFPRGDGRAYYRVVSEKPLKLEWIPCYDAWQVDDFTIRGLRLTDVKQMVNRSRAWKKMLEEQRTRA